MFELLIILSRYLFLFYIIFFLYESFIVVLTEQGLVYANVANALSRQKLIIVFFHLSAMLILSYIPSTFKFDVQVLFAGTAGLIFFLTADFAYKKIYKGSSPLIWNGVFFLMDIGFIMLERLNFKLAQKQLIWFFIALSISLFIPLIFKILPRLDIFKYVYLALGLILLFSTLLFGITEGGATNWITIKGITFQPSEAVKLLFIFYLCSVLSNKPSFKQLILPAVMSGIFILCLVFQTDLGSALIFFMTFLVILYISTSNYLYVGGGICLASIASVIAYFIFGHVKTRVSIWLDPWKDIDSGGYQIVQSLFALTSWGLLGNGLTRGMSKSIPVVERDFIFAAICEEFGMLFGICVILIFLMIFFQGVKISLSSKNRFLSLLAASLTSILCFQTFLIIGGVTKFIPLTGVTLPFVSYGGSSLLISFVTIGIIQWISIKNSHAVK